MQRELDEYYNDETVFESDLIKFKDVIKTIDIKAVSHSQREYCELVELEYKKIFGDKND